LEIHSNVHMSNETELYFAPNTVTTSFENFRRSECSKLSHTTSLFISRKLKQVLVAHAYLPFDVVSRSQNPYQYTHPILSNSKTNARLCVLIRWKVSCGGPHPHYRSKILYNIRDTHTELATIFSCPQLIHSNKYAGRYWWSLQHCSIITTHILKNSRPPRCLNSNIMI